MFWVAYTYYGSIPVVLKEDWIVKTGKSIEEKSTHISFFSENIETSIVIKYDYNSNYSRKFEGTDGFYKFTLQKYYGTL